MSDQTFTVPPAPPVRRIITGGMLGLGIGLGGALLWSATAPLSSAAIAPGIVTVDSNRKIIQHLEGGVIADILVRDGDRVAAGQVLIRLDDIESRASYDLLEGQHLSLLAQENRLEAEREDAATLVFAADLEDRRGEPELADILSSQERIFAIGREALGGQEGVLRQRIAQIETQIAATRVQLGAGREQIDLIAQEMADVRQLVEKGLERKPRYLALERQAAFLRGQQGEIEGRVAQAHETIAETELQIIGLRQSRMEKAALELRDVEARRAELGDRLTAAAARLTRNEILAPRAGVVMDLRYHTLGGVVPPGGAVLDLVPDDDLLTIDVRIDPRDIDVVHAGLPAGLMLSAYNSRTTPKLDGIVTRVSADALTDERTGQTYFSASIAVDDSQLARLDGIVLAPGMPAEAYIETGQRTLLNYLLQPLTDSFRRAFRES